MIFFVFSIGMQVRNERCCLFCADTGQSREPITAYIGSVMIGGYRDMRFLAIVIHGEKEYFFRSKLDSLFLHYS